MNYPSKAEDEAAIQLFVMCPIPRDLHRVKLIDKRCQDWSSKTFRSAFFLSKANVGTKNQPSISCNKHRQDVERSVCSFYSV